MKAFLPHDGNVVIGDVDAPQPATDEAVVAVEALSVNRGEALLLEPAPRSPP